jgi:NAD(P)H-dependent flavin oxidoreductase YrpB (nitropropane dioxygenase family)
MYRSRFIGSSHPFITEIYSGLSVGVDIIGAQGGEGGGHTGDTPFSILIPAVVDLCKNVKSPLTGEPVVVVAAGGIADGRGLAASLACASFYSWNRCQAHRLYSYGAHGVWVGTRFVASVEAGAPKMHKQQIVGAGFDDVIRTTIYTGRPLNLRKTQYIADWETKRSQERDELLAKGLIPHEVEVCFPACDRRIDSPFFF